MFNVRTNLVFLNPNLKTNTAFSRIYLNLNFEYSNYPVGIRWTWSPGHCYTQLQFFCSRRWLPIPMRRQGCNSNGSGLLLKFWFSSYPVTQLPSYVVHLSNNPGWDIQLSFHRQQSMSQWESMSQWAHGPMRQKCPKSYCHTVLKILMTLWVAVWPYDFDWNREMKYILIIKI